MEIEQDMSSNNNEGLTLLNDTWVLWAHLPHDADWSLKSFTKIIETNIVEEVISLSKHIPNDMIKNCMLFYMRLGINPIWEDPKNRDGGCFTYKVFNKDVPNVWTQLMYIMSGETISNDTNFNKTITGMTISPKKSFCIIKIWLSNVKYTNPQKIKHVNGLSNEGCRFKKHNDNIK